MVSWAGKHNCQWYHMIAGRGSSHWQQKLPNTVGLSHARYAKVLPAPHTCQHCRTEQCCLPLWPFKKLFYRSHIMLASNGAFHVCKRFSIQMQSSVQCCEWGSFWADSTRSSLNALSPCSRMPPAVERSAALKSFSACLTLLASGKSPGLVGHASRWPSLCNHPLLPDRVSSCGGPGAG